MRGIRAQCGLDARKKLGLHRWLSTARQRTIKNWMSQQVYQLSRQTYNLTPHWLRATSRSIEILMIYYPVTLRRSAFPAWTKTAYRAL